MTMARAGALLALGGMAVFGAGFLWDLAFAGIPYQDPPPDLLARWTFHKTVADRIMTTGAVMTGAGVLVRLLARVLRHRKGQGRRPAGAGDRPRRKG
jgi:hypothetical protein